LHLAPMPGDTQLERSQTDLSSQLSGLHCVVIVLQPTSMLT
jgi:hypothetical protein